MAKKWQVLKTTVAREKFMVAALVLLMTVTFLILGFFLSSAVGFQTALRALEEQAQITIFFKDDFPEGEIIKLKDRLESDVRIAGVVYVSKEEAFKIFTELNKDEPVLLEAISSNILPASLEVRTVKVADLYTLASEFESAAGVEDVKFFRDVIDNFRYWTKVVSIVGLLLVSLFLFVSLSVVVATLRMSIHLKKEEIGILRLVGASASYIKSPFVFQGVFFGVLSSLISSVFLIIILLAVRFTGFLGRPSSLVLLPVLSVPSWMFMFILPVLLVSVGALLGYLGSLTAVKKYLKN